MSKKKKPTNKGPVNYREIPHRKVCANCRHCVEDWAFAAFCGRGGGHADIDESYGTCDAWRA